MTIHPPTLFLGFSSTLINQSQNKAIAPIPQTAVAPFSTISAWESQDGLTASTTNSFTGNFTKLRGNHSFRFGPEFRVYRESRNRFGPALSPQYSFNANFTKANDTAPNPTLGGEVASLLLGIPAGAMSITDSYVEQDKYFALYFQDDWKISRKLTMNFGLRYEYESPMTERFDRAAIHFAGNSPSPLNDAARANYARNKNAADETFKAFAWREDRCQLASTDRASNKVCSAIRRPDDRQEPHDPTCWGTSIKRIK
jgi:outer membrane receptor protein involved in Fe transport